MRTTTADERVVLGLTDRAVAWRARVKQGSTWYDLSDLEGMDWCEKAVISDDCDSNGMSAKVSLVLDDHWLSLSPYREDSKINLYTGSFDALMAIGAEIKIETATGVMGGGTPASWKLQFEGYIADPVVSGESIALSCVDASYPLINTYIETQRVYGSDRTPVAAETIMQAILDDNGYPGVTLYTPVSPGWVIKEYVLQKQPIMSALRQMAEQIGWLVRYRWDNGTSAFRLTFYEPDRSATTAAHSFSADEYYDPRSITPDGKSIRNVIGIAWGKAENRQLSTYSSPGSITEYGRRYMEIVESDTSQLDTSAEVAALGAALLADLSSPEAQASIPVDFFWPVQSGDYYEFTADKKYFSADQKFGIFGYQHTLAADDARTTLRVRGKPSGGFRRWVSKEARGSGHARGSGREGGIGGMGAADMLGPDNNSRGALSNYTMQTALGLGAQQLNTDAPSIKNIVVPNYNFQQQSRVLAGSGWPPDAWEVCGVGDDWGITEEWYYSTDSMSGGRALILQTPSVGGVMPEIQTKLFTAEEGRIYRHLRVAKQSTLVTGMNSINIYVDWYQADGTTLVSSSILCPIWRASTTYTEMISVSVIAPINARKARLRIKQVTVDTGTAVTYYWDQMTLSVAQLDIWMYRDVAQSMPNGAYTTAMFNKTKQGNEGGWYDPLTGVFKAPETGLYGFTTQVAHAPGIIQNPATTLLIVKIEKDTAVGFTSPDCCIYQKRAAHPDGSSTVLATCRVFLQKDEYARVRYFQNDGGARNTWVSASINEGLNFIQITKLD